MWEKSIFIADTHGDLVCPDAVKVVKRFIDSWQPKIRVHLGDVWDFRAIRRGASPEERMKGISYDYNCGFEFLEWYQPHFLTLGNHDHRLWRAATETSQGVLADLCSVKAQETEDRLRKLKIKWVPWKVTERLKIGNLSLIHGFHSSMHPAKAHHEKYGSSIFGHVHSPSDYEARHIDGGSSHAVGTLAKIDKMSYADSFTAKLGWRNGFAYGLHNTKTGAFKIWQIVKQGKDWVSPHGIL
jgi:predicted phosphodiesterase